MKDMGDKMTDTIRLTAAQAMMRWLSVQMTEEGERFIEGVWAIFGHGNVAGIGEALHVTGKEYSILELLSLRKGTTLTKEMFLDHLYGGMDEPELKIIDVFICKLRKKLAEATGGEHYIETVWGRGYVLKDPEPAEPRLQRAAVA